MNAWPHELEWRAELAQLTAAGIEPRYPWRRWFNGHTHHLVQGADYHVPTQRFQSNASAAARRLGFRLRTARTDDGCTLLAVELVNGRDHDTDEGDG